MGSWEDELDVDLLDIWAGGSKEEQADAERGGGGAQAAGGDDLAFPSQAAAPLGSPQPETRVFGFGVGVTRLQSENGATPLLNADVADAPTQVASLTAEPYVSRGGTTVPLPTQSLGSTGNGAKERLRPLPSFQPVVSREGFTVPIVTQSLASSGDHEPKQRIGSLHAAGLRNPKGSQQPGVGIRKYFTQSGSSSGTHAGGPRKKKPRIPGPVGDLFQREQPDDGDVVDGGGDGNGFGAREDGFNDTVFRRGAWVSALQSLDVDEFDPAKYRILNVTASSIGASRIQQRVPHFVAVIKELTPNVFGDAAVILKDPTGTVAGMMNHKVFSNTDYAKVISPGAVIVLKQVAIFSPSAHYLNITIKNIVQVFAANTDLPQGLVLKPPILNQESLPLQGPPPHPRSQSRPQPQFQPQSSPPQQEQQPPQSPSQIPSQPLPLQPPQPRSQSRPSPPSPSPQPPQLQSQPRPPPSPPQELTKAPEVIGTAAKMASWDLISPSPSPSPPREPTPPQEPKAPEGIAAAAKMAGWGDLTDDMEALLNEDVDDFYR